MLRLQNFCDGVARILNIEESNDFPPDAVHATWYFNQPYNWACPAAEKEDGTTPQPQATYGTIDCKVKAFLDEPASGDAQWVYIQVLGFWSTAPRA